MNKQLPPGTQAQFDKVLAKLLGILATADGLTEARSEFMDYDGSQGGQVLESEPQIEHPYNDILNLYIAMFEQAKKEELKLRLTETLFERESPSVAWRHKTRWVGEREHKAFNKKVAPWLKEVGDTLCKIGAETASDWYRVSYTWYVPPFGKPAEHKLLVLHGNRQRVVLEPTPELLQHLARVSEAARADGLEVTGVSWRWDDTEDEPDEDDEDASKLDSKVTTLHAWPAAA